MNRRHPVLSPALGISVAMCTVFPCRADTLTVDPGGGADFTGIQPAIDLAGDGDIVLLRPGEYVIHEAISFRGKAITVTGEAGAAETIIRMAEIPDDPERGSVVVFENQESTASILEGVTLTDGLRGVLCKDGSAATVRNSILTENRNQIRENGLSDDLFLHRPRGGGVRCMGEGSQIDLSGCTISGNVAWDGGGLYVTRGGTVTLTDCTIARNVAGYNGGGFFVEEATAILTNCVVTENYSICTGGLIARNSVVTLNRCTVTANLTEDTREGGRAGGVLFSGGDSSLRIVGSILWGNHPDSLSVLNGDWRVTSSCIGQSSIGLRALGGQTFGADSVFPGEGNISQDPLFCGWGDSGDVYADSRAPGPGDGSSSAPYPELATALEYHLALAVSSPCIAAAEGAANMGADLGLCDAPPAARTRRVHVASGRYFEGILSLLHHASLEGQGAEETIVEGSVMGPRTGASVSRLTITRGGASGILIPPDQSPEISDCTITENLFIEDGGGVRMIGASPTFINCRITRNYADESGGGVYVGKLSSPTFIGSTIAGNRASLHGGGMLFYFRDTDSALVENCRIFNNVAGQRWGGGVSLSGGATLSNCAIWGNKAPERGGIDGSGFLVNCTIAGNSTVTGGGIFETESTMKNCIVWNNVVESPPRPEGPDVSYSLIEGDGVWSGAGNINSDPRFRHGGVFDFERFSSVIFDGEQVLMPDFVVEEPDFRLREDSPAIDAGMVADSPVADLDGNERPCGGGMDMGAFEFCNRPEAIFRRGDANADGDGDVADAVFVLDHLFGRGQEPPCVKSADVNDSGRVDIADPVFLLNTLFSSGEHPAAPFPDCGRDPTPDDLSCDRFAPCM